MLPRFNLIVACDEKNGIGKNGGIPWYNKEDITFFRNKTIDNIVIMGHTTFKSLQAPLKDRLNIIIATSHDEHKEHDEHDNIVWAENPLDALIKAQSDEYKEVFVIGGEQIYNIFKTKYKHLIANIYLTSIPGDFKCDTFFELPEEAVLHRSFDGNSAKFYVYKVNYIHPEMEYLNLLQEIIDKGSYKEDRTGTGTYSLHGKSMEFDISQSVPFVTTKKLFHRTVLKELLWFLDGSTNSKLLEEQGINIWKGNSSKEFIESRGLNYEEGDIGPGYGFQWRHWGAEYKGCNEDYTGQGFDQIANLISEIKSNPNSRRLILTAWNVNDLDKMVLPPCHYSAQFLVQDGNLDCILNQRSGDMFLGVPFNLASYTLLTYIIAQKTNLKPRKLIHFIGDAHIYKNHIEQVKLQLSRTPLPACTIFMDENEIPVVKDYISWPAIKGKMAI